MFAGFGVTLVLARLLTPADYGVVALLTIFISISSALADAGFGDALVQKKNATDMDFNSVFYLSIVTTSIFYLILFFSAPAISRFYGQPILVPILRILALKLIFASVNSVQNAELVKNLLFDKSFKISLIGLTATWTIGITLAFLGYGPWAIVWSEIGGGLVGVAARWFIIAWRPKLMFSFCSLRTLFNFGWKISCVSLIDRIYNNLYGLLIGKIYTPADLALVNKGRSLPTMFMDAVYGTINSVTYPTMVQLQDNLDMVRIGMRKMLVCSTFLIFPMMAGLIGCAQSVVFLAFGENWVSCVPYVQIACFALAVKPLSSVNNFTLLALGYSNVLLKLEIVKKIIGLVLMAVSIRYGVFVFMLANIFALEVCSIMVNARSVKRIIGYTLLSQVRDVVPALTASTLMGLIVWGCGLFRPLLVKMLHNSIGASLLVLVIQVTLGVIVYGILSLLFRMDGLVEYWRILRPRFTERFSQFVQRVDAKLYKV